MTAKPFFPLVDESTDHKVEESKVADREPVTSKSEFNNQFAVDAEVPTMKLHNE